MSDRMANGVVLADEEASRWLNTSLGGDPRQTFCARLWSERWRHPWYWVLIWRIDRAAVRRFGEEPGHCRRAYENHRLGMIGDDLDERFRMVDGT
jgi:hypothetical protein